MAGRYYFAALRFLLDPEQTLMAFAGRNRRPPRDPFNAALSFGYSLLYRDLMAAILCVGLDPALGFFHTPRSAAYPLALDLMELFRTTLWDMPLIASVNRRQWNQAHFSITHEQVWLSADGRKLAIGIYEERKQERWRHPVLRYSGTPVLTQLCSGHGARGPSAGERMERCPRSVRPTAGALMSHDDEHAEKRWYLVCYDIRDPSRWREAYKTLCGTGERIQYSLFRCRLSKTEMERLRWLLEQILDDEDDLMLVHLCPRCAGRVQEKGRDGGWSQDNPRYEVL